MPSSGDRPWPLRVLAGLILATLVAGIVVHATASAYAGFVLMGIAFVSAIVFLAVAPIVVSVLKRKRARYRSE
jgi:predicted lysophospholipase L1 biosynthesis ABC-type transport system permease subunit